MSEIERDDENYMVICEDCGPVGVAEGAEGLERAAESHTRSVHDTPAEVSVVDE